MDFPGKITGKIRSICHKIEGFSITMPIQAIVEQDPREPADLGYSCIVFFSRSKSGKLFRHGDS
jgi:hypothetical protein